MSFEVIAPPNTAESIPTHSGDVTGDHDATVVSGIQGVPVNATPPAADGETWVYDTGTEEYIAGTPVANVPEHEGDVVGAHGATEVVAIRGIPVSATAPGTGDFLIFNGEEWAPQAVADLDIDRYLQYTFEFEIAASQGSGWYRPSLGAAGAAISGIHGSYDQVSGGTVTVPSSYTPTAQDGLHLTPPSPYTLDAVTIHHDGNVVGNSNWGLGLFSLALAEVGYEHGASGRSLAQYQDTGLAISHQDQYLVPMIWVDATNSNGVFGRITLRFKA